MAKPHPTLLLRGARWLFALLAVAVVGFSLMLQRRDVESQHGHSMRSETPDSSVARDDSPRGPELAAELSERQLLAAQIAMVCPSGAREFDKIELTSGQTPASPTAQLVGARPTAAPLRVAMNGSASSLGPSSPGGGEWLVDPNDWFVPEDRAAKEPAVAPPEPAAPEPAPQPEPTTPTAPPTSAFPQPPAAEPEFGPRVEAEMSPEAAQPAEVEASPIEELAEDDTPAEVPSQEQQQPVVEGSAVQPDLEIEGPTPGDHVPAAPTQAPARTTPFAPPPTSGRACHIAPGPRDLPQRHPSPGAQGTQRGATRCATRRNLRPSTSRHAKSAWF